MNQSPNRSIGNQNLIVKVIKLHVLKYDKSVTNNLFR